MKKLIAMIGTAVLLSAMITGAGAQSASHDHKSMDAAAMTKMMQDMMPVASDSASTKAYKEAGMKMMQDMHITFSGNSDVDFVRGMIPHHQGAIAMAKVQLQYGKDAAMKKMAGKIIADQEKEIAQMQDWLKKNAKQAK
jgi:uncharacterized protein (DUF305 family)